MPEPADDLERRIAAALTARADQLRPSDVRPDASGPGDVIPLTLQPGTPSRRRWPSAVAAGAVAAAAVVAVTVTLVATRDDQPARTASGTRPSAAALDPASLGARPRAVVPDRPTTGSTSTIVAVTGTLQYSGSPPTPTAGKVLVHEGAAATGQVVARAQAGADGSFTVRLEPGTYFLTGTATAATGPTATHQAPCAAAAAVIVRAGVQLEDVVSCTRQ